MLEEIWLLVSVDVEEELVKAADFACCGGGQMRLVRPRLSLSPKQYGLDH